MENSKKSILLLLLTTIPLILSFLIFYQSLQWKYPLVQHIQNDPGVLVIGAMVEASFIALIIYYIRHIIRNKNIDSDKKSLWVAGVFFGGLVVMYAYWYIYIWKAPTSGL